MTLQTLLLKGNKVVVQYGTAWGQANFYLENGRKDVMHPYCPALYQGLCIKSNITSEGVVVWTWYSDQDEHT